MGLEKGAFCFDYPVVHFFKKFSKTASNWWSYSLSEMVQFSFWNTLRITLIRAYFQKLCQILCEQFENLQVKCEVEQLRNATVNL